MERPYEKRLLDKEEIIEITHRCATGGNINFANHEMGSDCNHDNYDRKTNGVFCPDCKTIMVHPHGN